MYGMGLHTLSFFVLETMMSDVKKLQYKPNKKLKAHQEKILHVIRFVRAYLIELSWKENSSEHTASVPVYAFLTYA